MGDLLSLYKAISILNHDSNCGQNKKTTQDEEMSTVLIITLHEGYHHFSSIKHDILLTKRANTRRTQLSYMLTK